MKDLLHGAHASEINWEHVTPVLKGAQRGDIPYVYFIAEPDDGHLKIGTAADPIKRLRILQTGNPRRLCIERVIYGDTVHERLLHAYFKPWMADGKQRTTNFKPSHAKDSEWFLPAARKRILEAAELILLYQQHLPHTDGGGLTVEELGGAINNAMSALEYELHEQDEARLLGRIAGHVTVGLGS